MIHWRRALVPMRFQLSDWTLFSTSFSLEMCSFGLGESIEAEWTEAPPSCWPYSDGDGYMLRAVEIPEAMPQLSKVADFIRFVPLQYSHCYIDLAIGIEQYRSKFSSKTRSTIQRKVRKFKEHSGGDVLWRRYSAPDEMKEFHRLARQVSVKTYQERLLDAGIPGGSEFLAQMEEQAAGEGVRGYLLFDGEKPVSYLYCPVQRNSLIYAYLGYDPDYIKLSVGTVLQWLAVEDMFSEGRFQYFDFTEGESEHKRLFATHEQRRANVMFVRDTFRARLVVRSFVFWNDVVERLGGVAARYGVKAKLRRWMRFGR